MVRRSCLAVLAFMALAAQGAVAQESVRLRGAIASLDGSTMTLTTATGSVRIALAEKLSVTLVEAADLAKIAPGDYVGSGAVPQPGGTLRAIEVHIFGETMRGRGEGHRPWTGAPNGTMTNATVREIGAAAVESASGRILTLKYNGGEQRLFVPFNVPVVRYTPGERSALAVGARVAVNAARAADGGLSAATINLGKNGYAP
jgi:hypothetical protein